ncbi:hypothetical protein BVX99_02440, partial [bacterium F16]
MPILVTAILVLLAGVLGYLAWRNFNIWSILTNMKPTAAADITSGLVEAEGRVGSAGNVLISPLSQRECVYYTFTVEEKRSSGTGKNRRTSWRRIINDGQAVPCLIEDASGAIEVDLRQAKLHLSADVRFRSGTFNDAPAHVESLLQERYGHSSKGWVFNKSMRYTETMLELGDPIYAVGQATNSFEGNILSNQGKPSFWAGGVPLTVTDKGEGHVSMRYMGMTILLGLGAMALVAGAVLFCLAQYRV